MYPVDSSLLVVWSHELLYDASLEGQRYYEATVFLHWLRVRQPGCQKLSDHLACTTHPINNHCVLIHVIVHLVCYTRPEIFKKWEFYTFYILNKNLTVTANFLSRKLLLTKRSSAIASRQGRAMGRVNWNLANCHATLQKLLIRQVLAKSMVWSWRFSRRLIDNVHSIMTRPSQLPLSQVS